MSSVNVCLVDEPSLVIPTAPEVHMSQDNDAKTDVRMSQDNDAKTDISTTSTDWDQEFGVRSPLTSQLSSLPSSPGM